MRLLFSIILFLGVFSANLKAQIRSVSDELFSNVKKIDSTINLNDIDYELINLAVFHYTNKHRQKRNRNNLKYDKTLEKSALLHSAEMKKHQFFSHINKSNRKFRNLEDRAKFVGYRNYIELAENLYYGFIDLRKIPTYDDMGKTITQAFIDSRSHNLNLIDKDLEQIGLALVFKDRSEDGFLYYYFTQSFGTK